MQHLDFDALLQAMQQAAAGFERAGDERQAVLAQAYACLGLQHAGRLDEDAQALQALRARPLDAPARAFVLCASVWSAYARADAEAIAPLYAQMLDALEQADDATLWHRCAIVSVLVGLPGMAPLLERFARRRAAHRRRPAERAAVFGACTSTPGWRWAAGRLDEAQQWLARADEAYRWLGMTRGMNHSNAILHVMLRRAARRARGQPCRAERLTQDLQQHSPASHRRASEYLVLAAHSQASWVLQDAAAVRALDAALARAANPAEWRVAPLCRQLSQAFVALLDERLDDARALLEPLAQGPNRGTYLPGRPGARAAGRRCCCARAGATRRRARCSAALDAARASGEVGGALLAGRAGAAAPGCGRLGWPHRRRRPRRWRRWADRAAARSRGRAPAAPRRRWRR